MGGVWWNVSQIFCCVDVWCSAVVRVLGVGDDGIWWESTQDTWISIQLLYVQTQCKAMYHHTYTFFVGTLSTCLEHVDVKIHKFGQFCSRQIHAWAIQSVFSDTTLGSYSINAFWRIDLADHVLDHMPTAVCLAYFFLETCRYWPKQESTYTENPLWSQMLSTCSILHHMSYLSGPQQPQQ